MFTEIGPTELKARLAGGERPFLLDVRNADEFEEATIEGAVHIPLDELEERVDELDDQRESEIIVFCRSGNRSSQACMYLELCGFDRMVNLRGGMLAWE
jgi:rhodanese-related sulfurtransferase